MEDEEFTHKRILTIGYDASGDGDGSCCCAGAGMHWAYYCPDATCPTAEHLKIMNLLASSLIAV